MVLVAELYSWTSSTISAHTAVKDNETIINREEWYILYKMQYLKERCVVDVITQPAIYPAMVYFLLCQEVNIFDYTMLLTSPCKGNGKTGWYSFDYTVADDVKRHEKVMRFPTSHACNCSLRGFHVQLGNKTVISWPIGRIVKMKKETISNAC